MTKLAKIALGAALMAGAATLAAPPAAAHVSVGIGFGVPGYGYAPGYYYGPPRYRYARYCDPYSPYYDPYYCGDPYYDSYYGYGGYGPVFGDVVFFDGGWYRGPFRHRYYGGHDWYWVNNGWHRNEWHGRMPSSISFRNGGYYRGGRYGGFHGATTFGRSGGSFHGNAVRSGSVSHFNGGSTRGSASFHGGGSWHGNGGGHHHGH